MKWFYRYKVNGVENAVAGPFDDEESCLIQRTDHDTNLPKDKCGMPELLPEGYHHEFYSQRPRQG